MNKEKIIITIITTCVLILVLGGYATYNINKNAFYYATHSNHAKNEYPFIREANRHRLPDKVDKKYVSNINQTEDHGGVHAYSGRGYLMIDSVLKNGDKMYINDNRSIDYYPIRKKIGPSDALLVINMNRKYKLKAWNFYDFHGKTVNKKAINRTLSDFEDNLKENIAKPRINLQLIYNLINK
ncbi:hypothetical protein [Paucilactobacillus sp. N302-9]